MTVVQHCWSRALPSKDDATLSVCRQQAITARQQGMYQPTTLRHFHRVWQQSGHAKDWLQYLRFRRSLGYPLTAHRAKAIASLLQGPWWLRWKHGVLPAEQRQFAQLLQEYQQQLPEQSNWLTAQLQQQDQLLQNWMQRCRQAHRIAIVGNSGSLAGSGAGAQIDQADLVIRFNHCFSDQTSAADAGQKTDIWVVAPGFRGPQQQTSLTILSGPAMLWHQQQFSYLQQVNAPLLQVPLDCWRKMVRQFAAPPSAAPLVTQLLLSQGVKPTQLQLFGLNPADSSRYHFALPAHQPSPRHHWKAEQQWWQQLRDLGAQ